MAELRAAVSLDPPRTGAAGIPTIFTIFQDQYVQSRYPTLGMTRTPGKRGRRFLSQTLRAMGIQRLAGEILGVLPRVATF